MIHKFSFDGTRLVFDVHSGALHVVDQLAWDLLDNFGSLPDERLMEMFAGKYPPGEVAEALEEIRNLNGQNMLFSPDPLGGRYTPPEDGLIKAICLHLAHDCNLRCRYCFAGQGKFGGAPGLMSPEVGRSALEFLIAASGPRKQVEVDFFGGEPLLNFNVLRMLVDYGRKLAAEKGKEIKFTVTTNAVLLNREAGEFLNKNQISVVLSLDGRPGVHDAMRPFPDGSGSHTAVVNKIRDFLASRDFRDYYIRGTYTAFNTDFSRDVEYIASLGFDNISLEPVVAGCGEAHALKEEDLASASSHYEDLVRFIIKMDRQGRKINFFHFNIDLEGGPCLQKRMSGCGAGHQYLAVDPGGVLYPCHQFAGREEFIMGDVFSGINRRDLSDKFKKSHLYSREGCGECWAKYFCSGGCHANSYIHGGSLDKPYRPGCILVKKRIECALYLYHRKKMSMV